MTLSMKSVLWYYIQRAVLVIGNVGIYVAIPLVGKCWHKRAKEDVSFFFFQLLLINEHIPYDTFTIIKETIAKVWSAYHEHFEHYMSLPNLDKLSNIPLGLAIMWWTQWS